MGKNWLSWLLKKLIINLKEKTLTLDLHGLEKFGEKLAHNLDHGNILCLFGELGSGKTTFARSIIRSIYKKQNFEAPHSIKSPSFPILITYEVNNIEIYHYDLYRISNTSDLFELNIFENLENLMTTLKEDAVKFFEKGNKSAGVRTRKGAQEMKNLLQDLRKEVLVNNKK